MSTTAATPAVSISRTLPLDAAAAWDLLSDVRNHARWIPMTRIEVRGLPIAAGTKIIATSGPFATRGAPGIQDKMRVDHFEPPTDRAEGVAVFTKVGPLLLGTAEVRVAPLSAGTSRATWVEDVYLVGPLPAAWTRRLLAPVLAGMVRFALWQVAREVAKTR